MKRPMFPNSVCLMFVTAFCICFAVLLPAQQPKVQATDAILRGPVGSSRLALVFTGHEFAEGGEVILDELKKRRAKASFFLTGDFLAKPKFESLIRRIVDEGHYLGPHSDKHLLYCDWTVEKKSLVTREQFNNDLQANLDKITRLGMDKPKYFLPPYEHFNAYIAKWTAEANLKLINFTPGTRSNADYTNEGSPNFVSSRTIYDSILTREREDPNGLGGYLLLLHVGAGPKRTDQFHNRFGALLEDLVSKGYQFVRVDTLLESENEVFLRANQVGYNATDAKIGVAFSKTTVPDKFSVIDATTGAAVFEGETQAIQNESWGQFSHHAKLDFTSFKQPGRFRLQLGTARSLPFHIKVGVLAELPDQLLEFMRQQRCGYNPWLDTKCHQLDGRTAYGALAGGTRLDATGGWHDAGDLLKYQLTSGNATAQMLLAYLLTEPSEKKRFADHVDDLGKPGPNNRLDLLDEARWGLDWLHKLHPAPDQLYHQVADDRDHYGLRLPQNEAADYGWGKGGARVVYYADGRPQGLQKHRSESTGLANLAGRFAAAMGLAWQIWKDDPKERAFAERCLKAGKEVYELGRAKEGVQQGNSYGAPYRYEETTWADDMEWGAAELFRATGEARYLAEAKRYATLAGNDTWMGKEQVKHYQFYPFMNLGHFRLYDLVDADFQKTLAGFYRQGIENCVTAAKTNPYRIGVPFIWCSNNLVVALATQCHLYELMTGDQRYREFAARHRDWLVGCNPWGFSMFTMVGSAFPKAVHLQTTKLTGRQVRGGLVDGPVYERIFKSLRGVSITQPDPFAPFQDPRAVYHDDYQDYSTNEPTMDGTASAILMWVTTEANPKKAGK